MCGIVGIVGHQLVAERLVQGLGHLEYRGYDSAGIATVCNGNLQRLRAEGKLINLKEKLSLTPLHGFTGIGHTRWATHGKPSENNAHPHSNSYVAVVHNGIIENYAQVKENLIKQGFHFESETDTEVVVHLISSYLQQNLNPEKATAQALKHLEGAFALAILFKGYDNLMIVARRGGSPLAIGYGKREMYVGSDAIALAPFSHRIAYLEDGDWAILSPEKAIVFDQKGKEVTRLVRENRITQEAISKNNYAHYMLKEIFEQPIAVEKTLTSLGDKDKQRITSLRWKQISRISITACGTAFYAGHVAKYWFEQLAGISCDLDIASEMRYRKPPLPKDGLSLFISQSGETIDTIGALEYAKSCNQHIVSIVNVPESAIARNSDTVFLTQAGPEIGVASTKAFTTQLTVLAVLAIQAGIETGFLTREKAELFFSELGKLPTLLSETLTTQDQIKDLANSIAQARDVLYFGRGVSYPLALEGALKLKEITYIHAEGYAAGEMKHGPIALIDKDVPVIVIAPHDDWFDKTLSNIQEVLARGAPVYILTDRKGQEKIKDHPHLKSIILPDTCLVTSPHIYVVPLQLLAYYTALLKGTDVDQPRNLAKSVTVE